MRDRDRFRLDESVTSIDWQAGELLALGSSAAGPLARVFLGSRAGKLIRASPVPVLVLVLPA